MNHSVDDYGRNLDCVIFQCTMGRGIMMDTLAHTRGVLGWWVIK